ncbi:MAG: CPBP family glutamic-type intramembrane protease [Pseudomonadota bacterium]
MRHHIPLFPQNYGLAVAWLIFRVLGSVITVPIAEELAFRGYALRRLISSDFDKISPRRFTWLSHFSSFLAFQSSSSTGIAVR